MMAGMCVIFRAVAQLGVVPEAGPQAVVGGGVREVEVRWHNDGSNAVTAEIRARMWQASPALAMPVGEVAWKRLEVLPGQTVEETAALPFPAVRGKTRFIVEWVAETNVLGRTEAEVFPTNLLRQLRPLLGDEQAGLLDPNALFGAVFKQNGVETIDLGEMALADFTGRLVIVGPFPKGEIREGLTRDIEHLARNGAGVVWIQPLRKADNETQPSYYEVSEGKGTVVVAQAELVADFGSNPESQRNLVELCKLAVRPHAFALPKSGQENQIDSQ